MFCMRHHHNVPLAAMLSKLLVFVGTDGLSPAGAEFATKLVRAGIDMCVDQWSGDNWNTLLRGTSIDVGVACLPCLENYKDSAVIPKAPVGSVGLAQSVAQRATRLQMEAFLIATTMSGTHVQTRVLGRVCIWTCWHARVHDAGVSAS